jgi:hypothetical protein
MEVKINQIKVDFWIRFKGLETTAIDDGSLLC